MVNRVLPWVVAVAMAVYYASPLVVLGVTAQPLTTILLMLPALLALALLPLRRRATIVVVAAVGVLLFFGPGVAGVAAVVAASVARHRDRLADVIATMVWFAVVKAAGLLVGPLAEPWDQAATIEWSITVAGVVTAGLVGLLSQSRQEIDQARAASAQARLDVQEARVARARAEEREAIAREMHDALAHRISMIALHSGALAHRPDLDPEQTQQTAVLIRDNARRSLEDLRTVLSSLRSNGAGDTGPEQPQPDLTTLPVLVAEIRDSQPVSLAVDLDPAAVPDALSRNSFRMIQESLTNACKHAPGSPITVRIAGEPGNHLRITVRNRLTSLALPDRTGSQLGLVGIIERATALHGTVDHGPVDDDFVVTISLPWKRST